MGGAEGSRSRARIVVVAALAIVCLALAAGCGGGSPDSTGTTEQPVAVGPLPGAIASTADCDLFAAVGGSDTRGDGSRENPWEHVDFLVSRLTGAPGRAVGCLRSGSYTPTTVDEAGGEPSLRFDAPGVTLTSSPGERARIVGRIFVSPTASGATISNLDLATQSDLYPGASCTRPCGNASFSVAAPGVTVSGNDITNDGTDICLQLVRFESSEVAADGTVVAGNRIHDCGRIAPKRSNTAHAIYVNDTQGSVVSGNLIYDTGAHGVKLAPRAVGTTVSDNVIDSNAVGVLIGDQTPCPSAEEATRDNLIERNVITRSQVRNNIEGFWVPAADSPGCFDIGDDTRGNVVSHNCVYADNPDSDGPDDFYNVNGGISLRDPAVPESGGFEDDGTNFEITPAAQPQMPPIYADPGNDDYHLLSADGDGDDCLEADGITDLAASANARWSAPTELAAEPGAGEPAAAMGPDGAAAVAWERRGEIRAIVRGPGSRTGPTRWGPENPSDERPAVETVSADGADASVPEIGVGGSGDQGVVVAAWSSGGDHGSTVEGAVWSGGSWSDQQALSGAGKVSGKPAVAVADDGAATVIWPQGDTVVARALAPGATKFGGAQSMPAAGAESVRVAAGAADAAVAVWRSGDGEHGSIAASRFDGGSWSEPVPISGGPGSADLADVAMSGDTAVAVWRQENAGGEAPAAAVSSEGGDWSEPAPLADPVGHLGAPVVAAGGGTTVAAWSADGEIMVSACPDEGDFATAGSIGAAVGSDDPRVAVGVDGRAILTWSQPDAESDTVRVMGASRSVVGTWSAPEMLSTFLPRLAVSGAAPAAASGGGIAVWREGSGATAHLLFADRWS